MRAVLVVVLMLLTAPAAMAQSLLDQVVGSAKVLGLSMGIEAMMSGGYFDLVTTDLAGTWTDVTPFLDQPEAVPGPDVIASACTRQPIGIAPGSDPLTMRFTLGGVAGMVTTIYTYAGGTSFATYVNSSDFLKRLGLADRLDTARQQALISLAGANAPVSILRPSRDVFMVIGQGALPRIIARCSSAPGPTAAGGSATSGVTAGEDTLAVFKEGLGKVFDQQFANVADAASRRQPFIDCAAKVFAVLSPADLQAVIAAGFNPVDELRTRIESTYPGLPEGARACGEAAAAGSPPPPN